MRPNETSVYLFIVLKQRGIFSFILLKSKYTHLQAGA